MSHRLLSSVYIPRLGFDTPVRVTGKTQVTFLEQGVSDETLPLKEVVKRTLRTIEETYFDRGRDDEYQEALELLDSLRVAEALDRHLQAQGRSLDVFVQGVSKKQSKKQQQR